ncbi:sulfatase, partial [Verrucomicrobiota bacterium]
MNRRTFLRYAGAGIPGLAFTGSLYAAGKSGKPNILIIVTDDQGYADLSAYAHHAGDINTPNMDRMAKAGMLFTQAYVTAPVCSPSRAGWNTGQYQERWHPAASWNPGLPKTVKTIAEYLKGAGYATGKIGKSDFGKGYHSAKVREYPLNHGYDEFLGFSAHAHDYFALSEDIAKRTPDPDGTSAHLGPLLHNNTKKSYESGYITDILTDAAVDYIKLNSEKPFFLNVAYNSVHHLIHEVPEKYLKKFGVKPIPKYNPDTMGKYRDYYLKYCTLGAINDQDMRKY